MTRRGLARPTTGGQEGVQVDSVSDSATGAATPGWAGRPTVGPDAQTEYLTLTNCEPVLISLFSSLFLDFPCGLWVLLCRDWFLREHIRLVTHTPINLDLSSIFKLFRAPPPRNF